jgi:hypothetical protein
MGYEQFSSKIKDFLDNDDELKRTRNIQRYFDGRLVIFDEIHHANEVSDDIKKKNISKHLMLLVSIATIKMVLLTATPMFNSCKEIIWLITCMNLNEKRSQLSKKADFS